MEDKNKGTKYYNPDRILNMKDLDKKEPNLYLISSNRSAGKTTSFLLKCLRDFRKKGNQFILLYRYNYEISSANMIFNDVMELYPKYAGKMEIFGRAKGLFYELKLDGVTCGFSLSMNNPDSLKKYSALFKDVTQIVMDEFQSETGKYLNKEVDKLLSIYMTVARGGGSQSRNVKCFLLGNMITIMNPYFIYLGIHKRLRSDTKFIRGNGWVAEFNLNEFASEALSNNNFYGAFSDNKYVQSSVEGVYLYDSKVFIDKPKGRSRYIVTIKYEQTYFAVREFYDEGIIFVNKKPDMTYPYIMTFKANDHSQNTIMLDHYSYLWKNLSDGFKQGILRFDDEQTKEAVFEILGVDLYK